jgi:hypothetical protein
MKIKIIILSIILAVGGLIGNALRYNEVSPSRGAEFGRISLATDTYFGKEYYLTESTAEVLKADTATNRSYTDQDATAYQLFIAYFGSQKYGSQIHSPKHCLPGGGWRIELFGYLRSPEKRRDVLLVRNQIRLHSRRIRPEIRSGQKRALFPPDRCRYHTRDS